MPPNSIWIGPLWRSAHWALLRDFYTRAEDYVRFETGEAPDPSTLTEFWTEVPPGGVPADTLHIGLFEKETIRGIAALSFGFPTEKDAYIGLLLIEPAFRNHGHGQMMLAKLVETARTGHALRLNCAVLSDNDKGLAFWRREGFCETARGTTEGRTRLRMTRNL